MPELVCSADDPRWLEERRRGVTATDITVIAGLSPYDSAYSLFFKKRGDIPDMHEDNDRLRLGRELEPITTRRWSEANSQYRISRPGGSLWRSSARSWQMATPDGLIGPIRSAVTDAVLEVKSWADADRDRWADGPPARVRAQVLWQMDTLDVATGHVGVLFLPSGEFRSYVIEHPDDHVGYEGDIVDAESMCEVCRDVLLLRLAAAEFLDRLSGDLDPPSPDASSTTLAALKARFADPVPGKEAEIDLALWNHYTWNKRRIDEHEEAARKYEAEIREQAGEAKYLTVNGAKVATRVISDQQVKAHTRHVDYIRRSAARGETDGA